MGIGKTIKSVACLLLLFAMIVATGCSGSKNTSESMAEAPLSIRMLDVGQGDALLIQTPEQTILIDTGDVDERDKFLQCLKKAGVKKIDKLIITHPHADHIGGAAVVFKEFEVKEVYDNGQPTNTNLYRTYLKTIRDRKMTYKHLATGDELDFGGGVTFKVFSPTKAMVKDGDDLNTNSIVGRLSYKDFSMLFTGDSTAEAEKTMLNTYGASLKSTLLKSPHHGSKTSSDVAYLKQVAPEAAFISLGAGNEYGHPHKVTLNKYERQHIKVYRTDTDGTVTIQSDGNAYNVSKEK
jgi:competence protein ComEC